MIHQEIQTEIKSIVKLALFGPVFFLSLFLFLFSFSNQALAEVKIAVIDTGFCTDKIQSKIKIEPAIDLTQSVKIDCSKADLTLPRFHGQQVLQEFLTFFDNKKLILHIYPLVIFDNQGEQKKIYWMKAIEWIKQNKIDFVLTASGLITAEKIVDSLPAVWFVPSGRVSPQLNDKSSLFPQNLAPQENLFLIGDYYDGRQVLYDQGLLYKDKIDYFFPSGMKGFKGTSRAVAEAAARALNLCPISSMRSCLKKLSKVYIDNLSHSTIKTF